MFVSIFGALMITMVAYAVIRSAIAKNMHIKNFINCFLFNLYCFLPEDDLEPAAAAAPAASSSIRLSRLDLCVVSLNQITRFL